MRQLVLGVLLIIKINTFAQLNCNNWLSTTSGTSATIGDIDVTGNQLTVEAVFNANYSYASLGYSSSVVSKHSGSADCNYSLRVHAGEITTTNGYFSAGTKCDYEINKIYHVALVYNGSSLIFYRNGFKLTETAATGKLVTNNLLTVIGDYANRTANESLPGYINEVRIWNVARSQDQIKQYMNTTLPTTLTRNGLLAYYTFDNLLNKQGNNKFDAKLFGNAKYRATNPNCNFEATDCAERKNENCNNWLYTPNYGSSVTIGDVDVVGDKLTVEVNFNSISKSNNGSWGHLISKHTTDKDVNYAISPNGVEITTTNGYFYANQKCAIELNKNYHVALVYDGNLLKFYRNGFLISETSCNGQLAQNNLLTTIANIAGNGADGEQFNGYINEVRIWNVAHTVEQIKEYMNTSLPSPDKQNGLKAYFSFNSLRNKQGNDKFRAILNGDAEYATTNPNCTFKADNCENIIEKKSLFAFDCIVNNCKEVEIHFTKNENIKSFQVDFGDNQFSNNEFTIHRYAKTGVYNIVITALGNNGKYIKKEQKITIEKPIANFSYLINNNMLQANFTNNNEKNTIYNWNFGDGKMDSNKNTATTHQYEKAGIYNISLIAQNINGCKDTMQKTIVFTPVNNDTLAYVKNNIIFQKLSQMDFASWSGKVLLKEIEVINDSITVSFSDDAIVDGDSISVIYNNTVITTNKRLDQRQLSFTLPINKKLPINEIIMYAQNVGTIPPNTAIMKVVDGTKIHYVRMISTPEKSGVVHFKFK